MPELQQIGHGDTCPACKNAKVEYDAGYDQTPLEPVQPPYCYCPKCGEIFDVDFVRTPARLLAELIARDLFENGNHQIADRLVLTSENGHDLGGWCESAVVDRIFESLIAEKQNDL